MQVKITAHHVKGNPQGHRKLKEIVRALTKGLGPNIALETGILVAQLMRSGKWHKSRNKRYQYWRSWLRYRYGSSRARNNARRSPETGKTIDGPDKFSPEFKSGQNLSRFDIWRLRFLTRALSRMMSGRGGGRAPGGGTPGRPARANTQASLDASGSGSYSPQGALTALKNISQGYSARVKAKESDPGARDPNKYRRRAAKNFFKDQDQVGKFLRETRTGQKLMRFAELFALRMMRGEDALKGAKGGSALNIRDPTTGKMLGQLNAADLERAARGMEALKRRWDARGNAGPDLFNSKSKNFLPAVRPAAGGGKGFTWGVQTGQLAMSWERAVSKTMTGNMRGRYHILPKAGGAGRMNNARLTGVLQRTITRAGGDARLIRSRTALKAAIKRALAETLEEKIRPLLGGGGVRMK